MSRFLTEKYSVLEPYIPGEQPKDKHYLKLNTNESPYPPTKKGAADAKNEALDCYLYSDPESTKLTAALADYYGLQPDQVLVTNGSDEALDFAFKAFCDKDHGIVFPNITYGFYPIIAVANGIPYEEIPLQEDFKINVDDYIAIHKNIVFANPNAPTGIALSRKDVESIVKSNPDNIVIVDEAYVDFGAESCVSLIDSYDNILVCHTFSKSRALAGARVGYIMGNKELITDLRTLKNAQNPYNLNRMSQAIALAAVEDPSYFTNNCKAVMSDRQFTDDELTKRGFIVIPSSANFVFVSHYALPGDELYKRLKEKDVLVRHFDKPEIKDWSRITIGTHSQMKAFLVKIDEILKELYDSQNG